MQVHTKPKVLGAFLACAVLFSLLTVFFQTSQLGIAYIQGSQLTRHRAVLEDRSNDPWQYRVLSEYVVEGWLQALTTLRVPTPVVAAFVSFRVLQNTLLFLLAALYYRKLGLDVYSVLIGLTLLAWGMTHALYDSDLSFNTYSDIIFYLLAGLAILEQKYAWIIPITALAALNRETSGLIPLMLIAVQVYGDKETRRQGDKGTGGTEEAALKGTWLKRTWLQRSQLRQTWRKPGSGVGIATLALMAFVATLVLVRQAYGPRPLFLPYDRRPGLEILWYNLSRYETWLQLFATLGILPVLAIAAYRWWPATLQAFFWAIVPLWFLIHALASVMAESRLFLAPQALIFVPGALWGVMRVRAYRTP